MNPFARQRNSNHPRASRIAAKATWASRTLSGTLSQTRLFLQRQLWVWPIIAIVLLSAIGFYIHRAIESTMKASTRSSLETILNIERAMLERWMATQERNAEAMANDSETRKLVAQIMHVGNDPKLVESELQKQLSVSLGPAMTSHKYAGFIVVDRERRIRAASSPELIGHRTPTRYDDFVDKALDGVSTVARPFRSTAMVTQEDGSVHTDIPTMFVVAPIRDDNLQIIAALAFRMRPEDAFTKILQLGRIEETGETYAFDRSGLMLSNSRFDDELILLGVLADEPDAHSILRVLIRDPGGNLTSGYRPTVRRSDLPPTLVVQSAAAGKAGVSLDGHNDYRGVPSVAAWTWLDKYDFGLATEVDTTEAYGPLFILKRTFWALLGLLVLSSLAIFFFTLRIARLQQQARAAAIEARQLGQYKLDEKLGEGAMGVVYRGHHAMLRRPTAIKLLDADKVTNEAIARFEREVQTTSQLNHPNTVAIYDYGRTPEGVFYYAMEYIEGIDLQALVEKYGPQPPGRVIHMLQQVCGSLYEAHSMGLVHRDVKPANLMLTRRGGEPDVVKVLDFGLVKAREEQSRADHAQGLAGTPLYMSPEAIQMPGSVDPCSDLYAVGAVGYFLLTGHPVFEAGSVGELCQKHLNEPPTPPSIRLGAALPVELETVILACLEKSRSKRPQTARDLSQRLQRCPAAAEWSIDQAEVWWSQHERGHAPTGSDSASRQYAATVAH